MLDEECNASDVGASELFYGKLFPIFVVVESAVADGKSSWLCVFISSITGEGSEG